jgi:hypothetical protein
MSDYCDFKDIELKTVEYVSGKFKEEYIRLLKSGGFDKETDSVSTLIRVALENVASMYDYGNSKSYRNLKRF